MVGVPVKLSIKKFQPASQDIDPARIVVDVGLDLIRKLR
jgi:hypothetical protein